MAIDTLKVARRLREAGFSEPQAEAVVAAVQEGAQGADLATKGDLDVLRDELKAEMRELELRMSVKIEESSTHTLTRVAGFIFGALLVNVVAVLGAMLVLIRILGH